MLSIIMELPRIDCASQPCVETVVSEVKNELPTLNLFQIHPSVYVCHLATGDLIAEV